MESFTTAGGPPRPPGPAGPPRPPGGTAPGPGTPPRRAARRRPYIVLLAAVLVLGGLSQTPPGQALLRAAGVAGATETYSELAFADPPNLPRELVSGAELPPVTFHVRNATGQRRAYTWSLGLTAGQPGKAEAAARPLAKGETTLADGGSAEITPRVRVVCRPGPLTVAVRLDARRAISFQAECLNDLTGRQG
ncbi:hypothetical protein [Actinomadura hibisca]|uniref:hypothetical protein n=1 Tax=Actinomadura hibisca TaxID=68565 RepID=UPI00082D3C93|nr:hypothetical protein [Actinomadura hibisca]